jgi:predicted nucleic acid-binding protein
MPERCVDASVAIKWVIVGEAWRKKARKLLRDSIASGIDLIAPPLYEYEKQSVLQWRLHSHELILDEVDIAITRLSVINAQIVTHPTMLSRARQIARQFNQPRIYDSVYAALAELRGCEFWTADKAFFEAVQSTLPFVKYLRDYT